jgi:hypothetical protein
VIDDWRLDPTEDNLVNAIVEGNTQMVALILATPNNTQSYERAIQHYLSIAQTMKMRDGMIDLLVRESSVNLNLIPEDQMKYIVQQLDRQIRDAVDGCVHFSGAQDLFTREDIIRAMYAPDNELYSHLLRELIIKRRNLGYYVKWLITRMKDVSPDVRRMVSSAAASVYTSKPVVHSSPMFTAFSGFLLLANARIGSKWNALGIIETLSMEQGVTEGGISLAGGLIGAFLGAKRLNV